MYGTASAQVAGPAATTFPDTTVGAQSPTQVLQFTLTTPQTVFFSVPDSTSGPQDFFMGAITGCVEDGITVNAPGTVCSVSTTFFPAYPGYRNIPLKVQTSTGTYYFGLSGFGLETGLTYTTGNISTIAGTTALGDNGDNGPATLAPLGHPLGVATDYAGNVYISDYAGVRRVDATTGLISTVVIDSLAVDGAVVDAAGNIYAADYSFQMVVKKDAVTGFLYVFAGNGTGGDGVAATSSKLVTPVGLAVDAAGNVYISDRSMGCVQKVSAATGLISTVAGTCQGLPGASGSSALSEPASIALDHANNLYIADSGHGVVWKLDLGTSALTVAAGTLDVPSYTGDGGLATSATLEQPYGVAVDAAGDLYISDASANVIRKVTAGTQIISTIAGTGGATNPNDTDAAIGDGGPAASALFLGPAGIDLDGAGNLYVADNGHSRVREIHETATGPKTAPFLSPNNINFGTLAVGMTGNYWTVTLNNTTGVAVRLGSITLSDPTDFVETTNCGTTLQPYTNCNIQISFSPKVAGTINGTLNVSDDGGLSPQTVSLTGVGDLSASLPTILLSPTNINFGTVTTGSNQSPWTFTVNNTSGVPAALNGITVNSGNGLSLVYSCGPVLPAHSTCNGTVAFTPVVAGTYGGTISISDNAPDSPQTLTWTGTAIGTAVVLAPTNIDFGNQTVGTTSNTWTVTVNNTGDTAQPLSGPISVTGPFTETNNCASTLPAHSTCTVLVAFAPTAVGPATGALTMPMTNGPPAPVALTGMGTTQVPVLFFSPNNINFGDQTVGTTSNSWTVTLNNTSGTVATFLSPIIITGPFTESNSCGTTLAAYSTCNIVVAFAPTAPGAATGQISAIINGVSTPLIVALAGNGTAATPVVIFSPTNVNFGNQTVGTTSNGWTITLNNTSDFPAPFLAPLAITGSSDFNQTNSCGTGLAAHTTCNVVVTFTPSSATVITGQLTALINGVSGPLTVTLTGTGTTSAPTVIFSPTNIDFGSQPVGTPSNSWSVNLSNESGTSAPLTVPISITGDTSFTETNNCGTSLPAYSTCNVLVTFTPGSTAPAFGQLVALINGVSTPLIVALTGTGTTSTPVVTFAPTNIDFGNVPSGSASNPWTVTLNNESGTAITFAIPITLSGNPFFSQTNNCGTGLAAHSTCTVQVTFTPQGLGVANGDLVVLVAGASTPLTVALTGTGTGTGLQFESTSADLGSVTIGSSNSWTITLNNTSNTALTYAVPLELAAPPTFTKTDNCGTSLAAHSTCNIVVTFTPTIAGPFSGDLVVEAGAEPVQIVTLTGTGVDAPPALTFTQNSINFGNQMVGTSNSWTVTLNNTSGTAVTLSQPVEIFAPGYSETNNCGTSMAAHSSCNVVVTFAPPADGVFNGGYVLVEQAGPYSPQLLTLFGDGVAVTSTVYFAPNPVNFGNEQIGMHSAPWTVTLNNTGNLPIAFSGVSLTDANNFSQTNNCGTLLPAFSTCTVQVAFTPTAEGPFNGSLTALIDGVTVSEGLIGSGSVPPDYSMSVSPNTVTLAAGQSTTATFTFTPVGGFTGTVYFYCTNLPVGVTCNFNPPSVTANGSNAVQTSLLTITTTGPYSGTVAANHVDSAPVLAAIYLLPGTLLCGLIALRRRKLRGTIKQWILLMVMMVIIGGAVGCSGFNHFTPTGKSVVTVTTSASAGGAASGTASGTPDTHTAQFTLNITQ